MSGRAEEQRWYLQDLLQGLADLVLHCLSAEHAIVLWLDAEGRLQPVAQAGTDPDTVADAASDLAIAIEHSRGILRRAPEKYAAWSGDAATEARYYSSPSAVAHQIKSILCVPIERRCEVVGSLYADHRSREDAFDGEDLELLRTLATHVGIVIDNALLCQRLAAENELLHAAHETPIGESLLSSDEPERESSLAPLQPAAGVATSVLPPAASVATSGQPPGATTQGIVRPLDLLERDAILQALEVFRGNRTAAAQALGISVRKLQYRIKDYQQLGIPVS